MWVKIAKTRAIGSNNVSYYVLPHITLLFYYKMLKRIFKINISDQMLTNNLRGNHKVSEVLFVAGVRVVNSDWYPGNAVGRV